jgi:hypothetical protein
MLYRFIQAQACRWQSLKYPLLLCYLNNIKCSFDNIIFLCQNPPHQNQVQGSFMENHCRPLRFIPSRISGNTPLRITAAEQIGGHACRKRPGRLSTIGLLP